MNDKPVKDSILELIGNTPMLRLSNMAEGPSAEIIAKLESFNPMSSVKDRIALEMIEDAERCGKAGKGITVVEPTSGNTGIGLAMVCAVKGYKLILTMPETMTVERRKLLAALGAKIVLTEGSRGMSGAVEEAKKIAEKEGACLIPNQFENPANPEAHRRTTAKEIMSAVPKIDAFVAGVGTGGTITGVGETLKQSGQNAMVVAVEPENSPVLSGGKPGRHTIQGIGAGFIPKVLNMKVIDRIIKVSDKDAIATARKLARREGVLAGISSGAATWAALQVAKELGPGKTVVVVLPDTGERYLSTDLFAVED
jgi:cysteine synthase A